MTTEESHTVQFKSTVGNNMLAEIPDDDDICQAHINRSTVINILAAKGIGCVEVKERLDKMPVCANRLCRVLEEKALSLIKK